MTNQLFPEESPFAQGAVCHTYYAALVESLLPDDTRPHLAGVVCLPSFESEWALLIHGSERNGFSLTLSAPDVQIWGTLEDGPPSVTTFTVSLSDDFVSALTDAWVQMLRTVSYRTRAQTGLDGVTYHFFCHHSTLGRMSGTLWCPHPHTPAGRFVALSELLRNYVLSDETERSALERQLIIESASLKLLPTQEHQDQAVIQLRKETKQLVALHERGVITDTELAGQLTDAFASIGYPPLSELLDTIDLIPPSTRNAIRSTYKA